MSTATALKPLLAIIAGREPPNSLLEIRSRRLAGGMEQQFIPLYERDRAARAILNRGQLTDVYVGVAPRVRREGHVGAVARCWVLWVDIDSGDALARLRAFRPLPSIVVLSGSGGAHAYWALTRPLATAHAQRANRRLALALGADMAATDGARIMRPPGTWNHKHDPPRAVSCAGVTGEVFRARAVVARLADSHHYAPRPTRPAPPEHVSSDVALGALVRRVRAASAGTRNGCLFWACCRAVEDAADGRLDEHQALEELRAAGLDIGLSEHEVTATIRSALAQRTRTAA